MIEPRLWLATAKGLPHGGSEKIIHVGCGSRPSLFVKNDDDAWWCYCHRCRKGGNVDKSNPRVKQKLAPKTGWYPKEIIPLVDAVVSEPYNFREVFERNRITQYVTSLTYAKDTMRIYFPDDSASFLGLDVTGKANARFYAPTRRAMALRDVGNPAGVLVTGSLSHYLEACAGGLTGAVLVMNKEAENAALAALSVAKPPKLFIGDYITDTFKRSLNVLR